MMSHTFLFPLQSLAESSKVGLTDIEEVETIESNIIAKDEEQVPLYDTEQSELEFEDDSTYPTINTESENILLYLNNTDVVTIIEQYDEYSLVIFEKTSNENISEEVEILEGYIENKFLDFHPNDSTTDNSNQEIDEVEDESNLVVNDADSSIKESELVQEGSDDTDLNEEEISIQTDEADINELNATTSSFSLLSAADFGQRGIAKKTNT